MNNYSINLPIKFYTNKDYCYKIKILFMQYKINFINYLFFEKYPRNVIDDIIYKYDDICSLISKALIYYDINQNKLIEIVNVILLKLEKVLIWKVRDSHAFLGDNFFHRQDKNTQFNHLFLFRAIPTIYAKSALDMYHTPYDSTYKSNGRFNSIVTPCTYLSDSSYVVYHECNLKNQNKEYSISAFELTNLDDFIIDLTIPIDSFISYRNYISKITGKEKINPELFVVFPLLLAISFHYVGIDYKDRKRIEYAISNAIVECSNINNCLGVAYNSTAFDSKINSNLPRTCLAIPLYKGKLDGKIKITEPIRISSYFNELKKNECCVIRKIYNDDTDYYLINNVEIEYKYNTLVNKMIEGHFNRSLIAGNCLYLFDEYILSKNELKDIVDK